jgi:hypothetical protein
MQPEDTPTAMARFLSARFRREIFCIVDEVLIEAIAMSPITMSSTDNNYSIFSSAICHCHHSGSHCSNRSESPSRDLRNLNDTVWAEGT